MRPSQATLFILASVLATFALAANIPYNATIITQNSTYFSAMLTYTGTDDYYIKPTSPWVKNLALTAFFEGDSEFHLYILDTQKHRFNIPYQTPFPYTKALPPLTNPQYSFNITTSPFSFSVTRVSTGEVIFNTQNFDFVYSDLAIQFGTQLPTKYLYGLGERRASYLYKPGTYSIFTRDQSAIDDGTPGKQLYGSHPMYLMREASKNWHIMLFRNTAAMDFTFDSNNGLFFRTVSGLIDLKFFFGDTNPETVIKQYHSYCNGIALTPFWSHGWHQSRWGIPNFDALKAIVQNYTANDLPLDTIWSDIDYLDNYQIFTISPDYQPQNFSAFIKGTPGLHWVPIIDPGVGVGPNPAYIQGLKYDIFIKSPNTGKPLLGKVWPGYVNYPDFSNPKADSYWSMFCKYLHQQVPYSGLWIDMNEFSNFCDGECNQQVNKGINSNDLPYVPTGGPLETKTLSLGAIHYGGRTEMDSHSLNGFLEGVATRQAMKDLGIVLPFILSRSTSIGSGAIVQHWSGDNWSNFVEFAYSLPEIFSNQLFGNVMIGPDVCGFNGDATELLCSYWHQMAAVYPFARNHNSIGSVNQMPFDMGPTLLETARLSLNLRYSLLKWHYSIFVRNAGHGTTFRPMFYAFPDDDYLLGVETQFMLGHELLGVPCLNNTDNCQSVVYFPSASKFYDFYNGSTVHDYANQAQNITVNVSLNATLPLFISGGSIIHKQNTTGVNCTLYLNSTFDLIIALNQTGDGSYAASGVIMTVQNYTDEQNLVDKCTGNANCLAAINVTGNIVPGGLGLTINFNKLNDNSSPWEPITISRIFYYGVKYTTCKIGDTSCNSDVPVMRVYPNLVLDGNTPITLTELLKAPSMETEDSLIME